MEHLALREAGGHGGRIAALLGGRTPLGGRQVVPERAVHRQALDDEGVLDGGQELQLVEDLLAAQRPG